MPVRKGDVLLIPSPNDSHKTAGNKLTIHWQQNLRQRAGDYYLLVAKNITGRTQDYSEVAFYIQSEWYNEEGFNSASGMKKIDDDNYELTIDSRHQYAEGDKAQFIVWHDKDRKPYADRFLQSGFFSVAPDFAKKVLSALLPAGGGLTGLAVDQIGRVGQAFVGSYLKTF